MFGGQSNVAPLRRVLVRRPRPEDLKAWREYGWRAEPDPVRIVEEHEAFGAELERAGAEVVLAEEPVEGDPDAIYCYDTALVADAGAVLLRSGKPGRRGEPAALEKDLARIGVPAGTARSIPRWRVPKRAVRSPSTGQANPPVSRWVALVARAGGAEADTVPPMTRRTNAADFAGIPLAFWTATGPA